MVLSEDKSIFKKGVVIRADDSTTGEPLEVTSADLGSGKRGLHVVDTAGNASLASIAGKNAIVIKLIGATVGVDANILSSGDLLGLKLTIPGAVRVAGGSGLLQSIIVQDLTNQKGALDVVIFDSDPSGTTFTNNSALDIADVDLPKIIGFFQVSAGDYISFADNAVAILKGLALPVDVASGTSLYACLVSRDTKTYAANELSLAFGFLQD